MLPGVVLPTITLVCLWEARHHIHSQHWWEAVYQAHASGSYFAKYPMQYETCLMCNEVVLLSRFQTVSDGRACVWERESHCFTVSTRLGVAIRKAISYAVGRIVSDITTVHVALIPYDTKQFLMWWQHLHVAIVTHPTRHCSMTCQCEKGYCVAI